MLDGKVAIITGAGQGIGREIAITLAQQGAWVSIADIQFGNAQKVAEEITHAGGKALPLQTDVSSVSDIKRMVEQTAQAFGGVDILVNNAGILHKTQIEDITEQEWDTIMAVNLKGVFFAMQQVLPYMKAKKAGRIISMSSLAGRMGGYANGVGYSASKAGIIGLTMGVARRVAQYNITVNAVAPGTTQTDILKQLSSEQIDELAQTIPMKRLGKPENIAGVVAFLASDAAEYITGAVIDVNGGMFMG
jgi:NAD(P)-dependent dehydrogenase (short-subunit alcohol dehydrogenase family)